MSASRYLMRETVQIQPIKRMDAKAYSPLLSLLSMHSKNRGLGLHRRHLLPIIISFFSKLCAHTWSSRLESCLCTNLVPVGSLCFPYPVQEQFCYQLRNWYHSDNFSVFLFSLSFFFHSAHGQLELVLSISVLKKIGKLSTIPPRWRFVP